jgi:CubicO group peptidase (beta-lactamase class C family)
MDSLMGLSGHLLGLWLVIVGIAIAVGVLCALGDSLRHRKQHQDRTGDRTALRCLLLALALATVRVGAPVQAADAEDPPRPATSLEELDKRLADTFEKAKVPGVSVTVIEGGQIVLTKGYGYADLKTKRPVTPETVFRAGSISKSLTSIGVMMLVEEGKLSLDAKLADLMPELKYDNPWEKTDPIRLVHLLEHTTGFDDIAFRHYLLEGKDVPLSDAVNLYGPYKSRWKPGTMTSYCNSGPVIAGRIIEKVSGQRFQDFIASRLTGPLGMESAFWTREPQIAGRLSKSYKNTDGDEEPFVEILARPSGSLNVTSKDLAKLPLLMLGRGTLDARTYLSTASVERIERPETNDGARAGLKYGYGLGNMVYAGSKGVFHGHDGGIDGFVSKYEYAPGQGAGFVVMANLGTKEVFDAGEEIRNYLERDFPESKAVAVPLAPSQLEQLTGFYQSITPRQQMLAIIESIFGWQTARAKGGDLEFNGTKRIHVGSNVFRKTDKAVPNIVFVPNGDDVLMFTAIGVELVGKAALAAVYVLALVLSALYMLIWVPSAFLGRLADRGGLTIRLLPWLAMLSTIAVAGLAMVGFESASLGQIGKPGTLGWALYGATLATPVLGALALLRAAMGAPNARIPVRGIAWLSSVATLAFAGYLWSYGWIGIKLWE